ncbi:MAG: MotA/TolQ/ExbB proton channel family protein, partial [Pseudomonadota bacterium]
GLELYQVRNKPYDMGKEFTSFLNTLSADERLKELNWSVASPNEPDVTQKYIAYLLPIPFLSNLHIESPEGADCSATTCFQLAGKNFQSQPDLFARSLLYGSDIVSWSILFSIYLMMIFGVVFTALRARTMLDLEKWSESVRADLTHPDPRVAETSARKQIANRQSAPAFSSSFFEDYFGAHKREALEQECESKMVDELRRVWFVRYAVWLVPIIGFVGTIIGISMSTPLLGTLITEDAALKARTMQEMGRQLGVAFGTTLAGLLASIILQAVRFFYEEQFLVKEILRIRTKLVAASNGLSLGAQSVFAEGNPYISDPAVQQNRQPVAVARHSAQPARADLQDTAASLSGEEFVETGKVGYPEQLDIIWLVFVVGSALAAFAGLTGLIDINI